MLWFLLGITLLVSGAYLMAKANRKAGKTINSRKASFLWSLLEFCLDIVLGAFTGGHAFTLGTLSVTVFIIGFLMTLVNFLVLISFISVHVTWGH